MRAVVQTLVMFMFLFTAGRCLADEFPSDQWGHLAAGAGAYAVATILTDSRVAGVGAAVATGVAHELSEQRRGEHFAALDLTATVSGGALAYIAHEAFNWTLASLRGSRGQGERVTVSLLPMRDGAAATIAMRF